MNSRKRTLRLAVDAALAILLIASFMTGHADVHLRAALGLLFVICLVIHGVISHQKIVQTTKHVASSAMNKATRIDCCLGLAMVVLLIVVLGSGFFPHACPHGRGAELRGDSGICCLHCHACASALIIICALAHAWINRSKLEKLLHPEWKDA